jgi:hypothetical protein
MGANERDKPTFLDRYGLAGIDDLRSAIGGGAVFAVALAGMLIQLGHLTVWLVLACTAAAMAVAEASVVLSRGAASLWRRWKIDRASRGTALGPVRDDEDLRERPRE